MTSQLSVCVNPKTTESVVFGLLYKHKTHLERTILPYAYTIIIRLIIYFSVKYLTERFYYSFNFFVVL